MDLKKIKSGCRKLRPGFSLVELAVVLVIIGIIAAGVLKGRDLIENAKLKRVISEVHEIQVALGRVDIHLSQMREAAKWMKERNEEASLS